MDLEDYSTLMEIFTKASGKMTKQMVMEFIPTQKKQNTKENGLTINSMGKEKKFGLMEQLMKVMGKYSTIFKGDYKNGKKCGKGKIKFADGSFYEGEFLQNNIQGTGKYVKIISYF
jgi:hypothetical protein